MKRPYSTNALLLWLTAAYAASFIGLQGTFRGIQSLYPALKKPAWTPPDWVFGPVWTILYALIGVAAWKIWQTEASPNRTRALVFWWTQLILNALWPWLFFAWGKLLFAFIGIVLLLAAVATALAYGLRVDRKGASLMIPYLAWTAFATALNFAIWRMNR